MLSLIANVQSFGFSLTNRLREEKGATAVEYGIMVALIAVVIIVAVTLLGSTLSDTFSGIQCNVAGKGAYIPATTGTTPVAGHCTIP
ncbi:Flp family type IVb pilin [Arthrobacter sp. NPDC093128]|uniref:Flp family type IVb pilin n=1 Tax=Arthrobacter sp. NPDC093128 TaxID=3154979 RepID=UPI00341AB53E